MDLMAHWCRAIAAMVPAAITWWLVDVWSPSFSGVLKFLIAFWSAAYLLGRVIMWLRLWGAYIERQLIDIQALLSNVQPSYYQSGDIASFEPNALFEKLDGIEQKVKN
jgi:hypothetical protein